MEFMVVFGRGPARRARAATWQKALPDTPVERHLMDDRRALLCFKCDLFAIECNEHGGGLSIGRAVHAGLALARASLE